MEIFPTIQKSISIIKANIIKLAKEYTHVAVLKGACTDHMILEKNQQQKKMIPRRT